VLLVFSSPDCGPCNTLAPRLEKFHREHPDIKVVLISKGEPKELIRNCFPGAALFLTLRG